MVCAIAVLEKISIQSFITNAGEMFQTKYNLDIQQAATIIASPFIVFLVVGLLIGWITDMKGQKGKILAVGLFFMCLSHTIFLYFKRCPEDEKCYEGIFPMTLIGLANTMIQLTLYPQVNYLVREKYFGTAYGIIEAFCNVGLFLGPLIIAKILGTD
jgi:MFS family permease